MSTSSRSPYRIIAVILLAIVAIVAAILGGTAYAYQDRFYPGVRVGETEVGNLRRADGVAAVHAAIASRRSAGVSVVLPNTGEAPVDGRYPDAMVQLTSDELGLTYQTEAALEEAWSHGRTRNPLLWVRSVVAGITRPQAFPVAYTYDEAVAQGVVTTKVAALMPSPTPATVVVESDQAVVIAGKPGATTDTAKLTAQVVAQFASSRPGSIRAEAKIAEPEVLPSAVQPVADRLNALATTRVTLSGSKTLRPGRVELIQWFTPVQLPDGSISLELNSERIAGYLQDQGGKLLDFEPSYRAVVKAVAPLTTAEKLPSSVSANLTFKPDPQAIASEVDPAILGRFEGKYVLVDLSKQRLYRISGGTLEKTYVVSTGAWNTPTPMGTFTVNSKIQRAWSSTYKLWMPYWMAFIGTEYGLHELPEWPNGYKEGQNHLGRPVSHGCIRLGVGDAAELYAWTDVGTPVVVEQ